MLQQTNYTIGTAIQKIADIPAGDLATQVSIYNNHNQDVHVGGPSVATSNANVGFRIPANTGAQIWLRGGEALYAVTTIAATTPALTVLFSV